MNVVQLIRPGREPVKLVKNISTVQLIRPATTPARLVNTGGVTNYYGGASDAAQITVSTDLGAYYRLQKQL